MLLLNLPNELLILIAENLSMKNLNSLVQTNHRLNQLLTDILHRFAVQTRCSSYQTVLPPLHWAAQKGYEPLVRLLLDKAFEINARTPDTQKTALHIAAWQGHEAVARLLLDRGAAPDLVDIYGRSALHAATREGYEEIVKLLLERGADVSIVDVDGATPLNSGVRYQCQCELLLNILRLLLEHGADKTIDSQETVRGETALHWAIWEGNWRTARLLLDYGAGIEVSTVYEYTPVDYALRKHKDIVKSLPGGDAVICLELSSLPSPQGPCEVCMLKKEVGLPECSDEIFTRIIG